MLPVPMINTSVSLFILLKEERRKKKEEEEKAKHDPYLRYTHLLQNSQCHCVLFTKLGKQEFFSGFSVRPIMSWNPSDRKKKRGGLEEKDKCTCHKNLS